MRLHGTTFITLGQINFVYQPFFFKLDVKRPWEALMFKEPDYWLWPGSLIQL
jgi:hypothetical protein